MIGPKQPQPTAREAREAYTAAEIRDEGRCQRCLRGGPLNRHHRRGRGVGGRTVVENLLLLCGSGTTGCHGFVTGHPVEAVAEGWSVPGWADPAEFPAARWLVTGRGTYRKGWVVLDRLGGWREVTEVEARERQQGKRGVA